MGTLLFDLPLSVADRRPTASALSMDGRSLSYEGIAAEIENVAAGLVRLGLARGERVAFYLDKRFETVVAAFAIARAGAAFVPINPLLRAEQVSHIVRDCNVRVLVSTVERLQMLADTLAQCPDLRHVVIVGESRDTPGEYRSVVTWDELGSMGSAQLHRVIDNDIVAILYTSGSTGKPKGVVLSHRNMVTGAESVASYLGNNENDTLLAALPLSFDAGFSQLTTGFHAGAKVVLLNYLLPRDVLRTLDRERVTGLTAVPPLWIQLAQLEWPAGIARHLRYFANTGGRMPLETLRSLRRKLPTTMPYLMYGLTEAFRSTYLPPEEAERRPDSIGKAIPNSEILVLRDDGSPCNADEPGELVHRGALVSMGYWNDAEKTAERFRPLPVGAGGREAGLMIPEIVVFSGDTVRKDSEGFLYFIARRDEMIKTSGYRVSPTEIEEVLYNSQLVGEAAAFGVPHPSLGQAVVVVVTPKPGSVVEAERIVGAARERLPQYMVPAKVEVRSGPLPRNPNGKIDRKALAAQLQNLFKEVVE